MCPSIRTFVCGLELRYVARRLIARSAPGFNVAFANGITFVGGSALDSSLLTTQGFTVKGTVEVKTPEEEDDNNGDDGNEPERTVEKRSAEDSELALAA